MTSLGCKWTWGQNTQRGERHHNAKLSDADRTELMRLLDIGDYTTQHELAVRFGVSDSTVYTYKRRVMAAKRVAK